MRIQKKSKKKIFWTIAGLIVLTVILVFIVSHYRNNTRENVESVEVNDSKAAKDRITRNKSNNPIDSSLYDSSTPSESVPVTNSQVIISTLSRESNEIVVAASVRPSSENGTCVATFTNPNDRPVVRQVRSTLSSETTVCEVIRIPIQEFGALGTWDLKVAYFDSRGKAETTSQIVIEE